MTSERIAQAHAYVHRVRNDKKRAWAWWCLQHDFLGRSLLLEPERPSYMTRQAVEIRLRQILTEPVSVLAMKKGMMRD